MWCGWRQIQKRSPEHFLYQMLKGEGWTQLGREGNTYCVALSSMEVRMLGPLRMSALIHTGLRTFPSSVSLRRRSREGLTALRLLKSSLIPVERRPRAWELAPHARGRRN